MADPDTAPHTHPTAGAEEWVTTAEASEQTGRHIETIRRWIRDGRLEVRQLTEQPGRGRPQLVRRQDVMALIATDQPPSVKAPSRAERSAVYSPASRVVIDDQELNGA